MTPHVFCAQDKLRNEWGFIGSWAETVGELFITGLENLEKREKVTAHSLKRLRGLMVPALRQEFATHMNKPGASIGHLGPLADALVKRQWLDWHWTAAPEDKVHPSKGVCPRPPPPTLACFIGSKE